MREEYGETGHSLRQLRLRMRTPDGTAQGRGRGSNVDPDRNQWRLDRWVSPELQTVRTPLT